MGLQLQLSEVLESWRGEQAELVRIEQERGKKRRGERHRRRDWPLAACCWLLAGCVRLAAGCVLLLAAWLLPANDQPVPSHHQQQQRRQQPPLDNILLYCIMIDLLPILSLTTLLVRTYGTVLDLLPCRVAVVAQ